jgi:hypothetical protein
MISFHDNLYGINYYILCSKSIYYAIRQFKTIGMIYTYNDFKHADAVTVFSDDGHDIGIVFFKKTIPSNTIVHECVHACTEVFKTRGIPLTKSNDESFAYYLELIYSIIIKKIKNKVVL